MDTTTSCQRSGLRVMIESDYEGEYIRQSSRRIMASYRYTWRNLDPLTFPVHGVIARRAPDGTPVFNFPQTVWLHPTVAMNWGPRWAPDVEALAVNILNHAIPDRDYQAAIGVTSRAALELAQAFATDVLLTMPQDGGWISREDLSAWTRGQG